MNWKEYREYKRAEALLGLIAVSIILGLIIVGKLSYELASGINKFFDLDFVNFPYYIALMCCLGFLGICYWVYKMALVKYGNR